MILIFITLKIFITTIHYFLKAQKTNIFFTERFIQSNVSLKSIKKPPNISEVHY